MPLVKNKTKTGMVRVHRPDGMKYAEGEWDTRLRSARNWAIAGPLAAEQAIKLALIAFHNEFDYAPSLYVVEVTVQRGVARAALYEIDE